MLNYDAKLNSKKPNSASAQSKHKLVQNKCLPNAHLYNNIQSVKKTEQKFSNSLIKDILTICQISLLVNNLFGWKLINASLRIKNDEI